MTVKKQTNDVCINTWVASEVRETLHRYAGLRGQSLHAMLRESLERMADKARPLVLHQVVPDLVEPEPPQVLHQVVPDQPEEVLPGVVPSDPEPSTTPRSTRVHLITYKTGIKRNEAFEKKRLCTYSTDVGLKCGHDCSYCSTGAVFAGHAPPQFKQVGENNLERGYAMVDPTIAELIAKDAASIRERGLVQVCTKTDAWSPEAQQYQLGTKILHAILEQPRWTVRTLTKNAAIQDDFDYIQKHRDRVTVGISMTAGSDYAAQTAVIEPYASSLADRLAALQKAHKMGLRTFAMLCPVMPYALSSVEELVEQAIEYGAEEFFAEAVNCRGKGFDFTSSDLQNAGFEKEAASIDYIAGTKKNWAMYAMKLYVALRKALKKHNREKDLRYMLYESSLGKAEIEQIKRMPDQTGIIWID